MNKNQKAINPLPVEQFVMPAILDVCCGSRSFWFDSDDMRAVFTDKRCETVQADKRKGRVPIIIKPDYIADFCDLPFPSNTFYHVVFDPPHAKFGESGYMAKYYGTLKNTDWRDVLRRGFIECFRVLKPNGTLIFKWNELEIPVREILKLTPEKPLYGHKSGKLNKTYWIAFLKA